MDIRDVENLAKLARIDISEAEKAGTLSDMESILGYVKTIEEFDINGVGSPETEEYPVFNVAKIDASDDREFSPEIIIGQFPDDQDGFLKVKKIL